MWERRSGKERTTPLLYALDGDDVVIVASKGGYPQHPSWFHNLRANPEHDRPDRLREARRARAGRKCRGTRPPVAAGRCEMYGGYADYQRKADREIPVVILEPRGRLDRLNASGRRIGDGTIRAKCGESADLHLVKARNVVVGSESRYRREAHSRQAKR